MRKRVFLKSPVRENRTPGSVRGLSGNWQSYRDDISLAYQVMRAKVLITLLLAFFGVGQAVAQTPQVSIVLNDDSGEYKSFDDIKPTLVNRTDHSIFLFPDDCGKARLWLYYMNKNWRPSVWLECYNDPIEVKAGQSYQIPTMVWRPLRTYDGKIIERKDFPGKYRMMMRYTLTPGDVRTGMPHLKVRIADPNDEGPKVLNVLEVTKEFTITP
jgi:hypothetical protein